MTECAACMPLTPKGGWMGALWFTGALVACPCHLPVSMGLLTAFGLGAVVVGLPWLVYAAFGAAFIVFLALLLGWTMRQRDREVAVEDWHQAGHPRDR